VEILYAFIALTTLIRKIRVVNTISYDFSRPPINEGLDLMVLTTRNNDFSSLPHKRVGLFT
jgi:hypothetical protein